jgi:hypothetical protein
MSVGSISEMEEALLKGAGSAQEETIIEKVKKRVGRPPGIKNGEGKTPPIVKDKPPKRSQNPNTPNTKGWPKAVEIEISLAKYLKGISNGVAFVNEVDAEAIRNGADDLAHELVELGKVDPKFRQQLEWISKPGKYGGLLFASGAIVFPILVNHNLVPSFKIPTHEALVEETIEREESL